MSEHAGAVVASVVGSVALSIVLATNFLGQDAAIQARKSTVTRQNAVEFSRTLAEDFSTLGATSPASALDPDSMIAVFDTVSSPRAFEFIGQDSGGEPSATIRYEWFPAGTIAVDDSILTYYDVKRFVDGELSGGSSGAVTNLRIRLLGEDGRAIDVLRDIRQIEVGMQIVSNLGTGRIAEWIRFNRIIHPKAPSRFDGVTS
jgi:hypothetical protein